MFEKIQNLSKTKRKIILWSTMTLVCAGLLFWFVKDAQKRISSFNSEQFEKGINFSDVNSQLNKLQKIEIPQIPSSSTLQNATTEAASTTLNSTTTQ